MAQDAPSHAFAQRDVAWLIDTQAKQRGDKDFLVWEPVEGDPQTWTFASYAAETRIYAAGLIARGVKEGQCVAIYLDNCPEFLILWSALTRLGAIAVLINTRSTLDELAYFFRDSKAVGIITQPKYFELAKKAARDQQWITCTHTDAGAASSVEIPSGHDLESLRSQTAAREFSSPRTMAPATVIYTSGTTARPKGVVWTHANALWIASTTALHYQLTPTDVHPIYLPLFHSNGLGLSFLSTLWSGGTIILTPKFSASRFWDIAVRHRCTWAQMFWFALRAIADQNDPPAHKFRFWAALGDMASVRERWGIKTVGIYGMTETVGLCVSSDLHIAGPENSMGRVRPEWLLELRREDGARASIGETGQIWVRGERGVALFKEYLNNPEATASAFDAEGWLDTGDTAICTETGDLFFMGRTKDMLKVGGENVAAVEIEAVIARIPGVDECAVVGKPDRMLDEVPVAFVVASKPDAALEQTIVEACATALSDFKRPREIRFVPALPKGVLDKILKTELRARMVAEGEAA